jgi:hypothetical protein
VEIAIAQSCPQQVCIGAAITAGGITRTRGFRACDARLESDPLAPSGRLLRPTGKRKQRATQQQPGDQTH